MISVPIPVRVVLVAALTAPLAPRATAQVRVERNLPYVAGGVPQQTLDLYLPDADGYATVLFIHGGSLREGDTRASDYYAHVCEPFARAGIGCATMDYRLAPAYQWPAMPHDVAAALRWMRDSLPRRGGDPHRLFVFGHSSGCSLAAAVGTNPAYLEGVGMVPGDLAGLIPMGCILAPLDPVMRVLRERGIGLDSLRAIWTARPDERFASVDERLGADPSRHVGPHVPPMLIVIAERERFRPPILEQAAHVVDLMYEAGRPADIVIVPGTHYSSIAAIGEPGDPTFAAIRRFIGDPGAAGVGSRPSSIR